jgi:prolyl-tRNA editing enzyme YbaK/EbsC (Cys-tRNA(Pro) deacylase)
MWPESVRRVADALRAAHAEARIEEFPDGTPTAEAAARAVGAPTSQIVKSLVFVCDGRPVLALVPGDRRADAEKIAAAVGAREARVARADEVVAATGFEPGAVAPFPHPGIDHVMIERSLLGNDHVWVGAGSPKHMARLRPGELLRLTRGRAMDAVAAPAYHSS